MLKISLTFHFLLIMMTLLSRLQTRCHLFRLNNNKFLISCLLPPQQQHKVCQFSYQERKVSQIIEQDHEVSQFGQQQEHKVSQYQHDNNRTKLSTPLEAINQLYQERRSPSNYKITLLLKTHYNELSTSHLSHLLQLSAKCRVKLTDSVSCCDDEC